MPILPTTVRPARFAVLLAAVCCLSSVPANFAEDRSTTDFFQDEPDGTLIRRLRLGSGSSIPKAGLVVTQKRRWLPELRLLSIDATLTNKGTAAAAVNEIRAAELSFPAAKGRQAANYQRLTWLNDKWYGSTFWTGPDWTRVGRDWHHPGINTTSIRCFTAPRDGRATVTGRVYKLDLSGDGIRASIRHNRRTLWTATVKGNDAKGLSPKLDLDVRRGDRIRFIVHKLGRISYDTTRWDPLIAYGDGASFQASKGFSTTTQGKDGWSYEMEKAPAVEPGPPRAFGLGPDFTFRDQPVQVGRSVEFNDRNALPAMVLADGDQQSGIVAAVNPSGRWRLSCNLDKDDTLRISLAAGDRTAPLSLRPGESVRLPRIVLGAFRGPWPKGVEMLQRIVDHQRPDSGLDEFRRRFAAEEASDLNLLAMVQADWRRQDRIAETVPSYAAATAGHLEKARLLLANLKRGRPPRFLATEARQLEQIAAEAKRPGMALEEHRSLYRRLRRLKREIALANPLMKFGKLLFCKRVPTSYSHLVMQYFGWRARPGGGLFILDRPGRSLQARKLCGELERGSVLEPRLSYDARRIVFSYVECNEKGYNPQQVVNGSPGGYFHIWEINVDGTDLRRLTDGPYDDLMPAYLPDGGIVFSSTRRRGYARCFGGQFSRRWHVYTLHRMDGDGDNIRMLSCHDTNEWFPAVTNDGRIIYARWDYIDRDAVTHQNLWAMRPDGTNTTTVWGNATASPHCSFQAKPIPGSGKFVFTASAHHSITAGSIAVVDPAVGYDGQGPITRITPEIPFPEAESRDIREYYASPWPLSEKYFLVAYSPEPLVWEPGANKANALGIYLLDVFGNRELIYRDPEIGSTNPTPLVVRPRLPVLPSDLPGDAGPTGEMFLADVYQGLGNVPRGSIKQLRIVQIFPKTTHLANNPRIGVAGEENGRAILGTVPVMPDGSARFVVPAMKPILFQALDEKGFAYQAMRTVIYVQPGERVSCVGCHENRLTAPVPAEAAAMLGPPSPIEPGPLGGRPFSFVEMVQPVLDARCVECHGGKKTEGKLDLTSAAAGPWTRSYAALTRDSKLVPRYAQRNQIQVTPVGGVHGALGSGLMKLLREGHEDAKLSDEEMRRLAAWIDLNAIFYGAPDPAGQARQRRGEPVSMPEIQ